MFLLFGGRVSTKKSHHKDHLILGVCFFTSIYGTPSAIEMQRFPRQSEPLEGWEKQHFPKQEQRGSGVYAPYMEMINNLITMKDQLYISVDFISPTVISLPGISIYIYNFSLLIPKQNRGMTR